MASKGGCKVNTPDWSKAPEVATHWDKECDIFCDENGFWYSDGRYRKLLAGVHVKWGTSRYIPRHVQWRGPQDGLPPVGMEVWAKIERKLFGSEVAMLAKVIATCGAWAWCSVDDAELHTVLIEKLAPIQSDRGRAIEEMLSLDASDGRLTSRTDFCGALYDAGYRKT
jgi:hypothetical protein